MLRSAVCGNPLTLNSRLWRAIRLGPNGRRSTSVATAGERFDESERPLRGQQNIAQGLAEVLGAITTVLNRAQAPTRRMLVDQKGLEKPPVFSKKTYVWTKKVEINVSGVFPNVRGVLSFAGESQDAVTATSVALGVLEFEAELSTEIDGQLFIVLSPLTDGESFDVVMSA